MKRVFFFIFQFLLSYGINILFHSERDKNFRNCQNKILIIKLVIKILLQKLLIRVEIQQEGFTIKLLENGLNFFFRLHNDILCR